VLTKTAATSNMTETNERGTSMSFSLQVNGESRFRLTTSGDCDVRCNLPA
jgi:hypothetical protein